MKLIFKSDPKSYQWNLFHTLVKPTPWLCKIKPREVSIDQLIMKYLPCTLLSNSQTAYQGNQFLKTATNKSPKTLEKTIKEREIPTYFALIVRGSAIPGSSATTSLVILLGINFIN